MIPAILAGGAALGAAGYGLKNMYDSSKDEQLNRLKPFEADYHGAVKRESDSIGRNLSPKEVGDVLRGMKADPNNIWWFNEKYQAGEYNEPLR